MCIRDRYYLCIAGALNILLNLFFVIVCQLNVVGVALASAISQCVSAALILHALTKVEDCYALDFKAVQLDPAMTRSILALGLPAGFSAAVGLVSVFCGATNTLIPSILLAYELFGGVGLELIALGCGVCYMLSGTHGLYSSQLFVTEKLLSEYTESWGKRLRK